MDADLQLEESSKSEKFIHRRFPRVFRDVSRVLEEIRTEHRSLKTAVYSSKCKGHVLKKIYGMALSIMKNLPIINSILEEVGLPTREPLIRLEVAQILVHEIVKNHPLPGQSKPVLIMEKYRNDILKVYSKLNGQNYNKDITRPYVPKYARVQTTVTTVENVLEALNYEGFVQKHYDVDLSLPSYHKEVRNLKSGEFLQDIHFKDVLVFPKGENLIYSQPYMNGHLFLQDKASYIPVYALDPKPESIVLDCCAAPGMKTVHLACLMKNTGHIYALDKDERRFLVLQNMLNHGHVKNCTASCADFTSINPNEEPYSLIEYILIDPSCSGSGMIERMNYFGDNDYSKDQTRIRKLSRFQITLLKHALCFPSVKRIVYSTCSLYEEENEYVIKEALKGFSGVFDVAPAFPEWPTRGSSNYSFGKFCIRSSPEDNLTNGFFVAVINRVNDFGDLNGSAKQQINGDEKQVPHGKDNFKHPMQCEEKNLISQSKFYATGDEKHEKHSEQKPHVLENGFLDQEVATSIESVVNEGNDEKQFLSSCEQRKCKKKRKDKDRTFVEDHTGEICALENDPGENVTAAGPIMDSGSSNEMQLVSSCKRRKCKNKRKDKERAFVDYYEKENTLESVSGAEVATSVQISENESSNQMQLLSSCERRKCKKKKKDKEETFVEDHVVEVHSLQNDLSDRMNTAIPISYSELSNQIVLTNSYRRKKCKKTKKDKERPSVEDYSGEIHALKSDSCDKVNTDIPNLVTDNSNQTQLLNACKRRKCKKIKKDKERAFVEDHTLEICPLKKDENDSSSSTENDSSSSTLDSDNNVEMKLLNNSEYRKCKKKKRDKEREFVENHTGEIHVLENDTNDEVSAAISISESENNNQMLLLHNFKRRNCKKRKRNKEKTYIANHGEKRRMLEGDMICAENDSDKNVDTAVEMLEDDSTNYMQSLKNGKRRKCKGKRKDKEISFVENCETNIYLLVNEKHFEENDFNKNIATTTQVLEDDSSSQIQLPSCDESKKCKQKKNVLGSEFIENNPGEVYSVEAVGTATQILESDGSNKVQLVSNHKSRNCKKKKKKEKEIC